MYIPYSKIKIIWRYWVEPSQVDWGCRIHRLHLCRWVRLHQQVSRGPVSWGCRIHRLHLCRRVRLHQQVSRGPVSWGCRIHWLHLCRGVRLHQQVSRGQISWGCRIHRLHLCRGIKLPRRLSWYDTKQSDGEVPVCGALENMKYSFHCHCPQFLSDPES